MIFRLFALPAEPTRSFRSVSSIECARENGENRRRKITLYRQRFAKCRAKFALHMHSNGIMPKHLRSNNLDRRSTNRWKTSSYCEIVASTPYCILVLLWEPVILLMHDILPLHKATDKISGVDQKAERRNEIARSVRV